MMRTKVVQILKHVQPGTEADVRGWVRTKRESKQDFAFLEVNDGSSLANVQIVVDASVLIAFLDPACLLDRAIPATCRQFRLSVKQKPKTLGEAMNCPYV